MPSQAGLFDAPEVSFDRSFRALERIHLDDESWVDFCPGWVTGHQVLFDQVLAARKWGQRSRWMYEKKVVEPRLTAPWNLQSGKPLQPALLDELRVALCRRYDKPFDSIGFNLYRDGQDSVAWHRDHISKEIVDPIICLVSLGHPRKFLMRPHGGGKSRAFQLGEGALFVTGGKTQRDWDHAVPKVAVAPGPRISLAFRYGLATWAYGGDKAVQAAETPDTPEESGA